MVYCRELEGKRSGSLDQEFPGSVSEDNSSNSDVSETLTTGSVGSSTSQNLAAVSFLPTSQEHYRVNTACKISLASLRQVFDLIEKE